MKSSAKTILSLAAAMALGAAAAVSGCTVTSTTSNDFDGGFQPKDDGGGNDDGGGGGDGGGSAVCEGNQQQTPIDPPACQECLNTSCCTELKGCYNQDPDGGTSCDDYAACIDQCTQNNPNDQAALDACYQLCDDATDPGIISAYEGIANCAATNCASACGGQ